MKDFASIKSIISSIICKSVVQGKNHGTISSDELNRLANQYTDEILEIK